ncbi:MAG: lysylphosphatidylglycerol synthase domain-containing protein, partial [Deltaproteobacteria bacterium]
MTTESTPGTEGSSSSLARAWGRWPGTVLRLLLAALPIAWLSQKVQWHAVFARAAHVGAAGLALSVLATFGTLALGAVRWGLMLRAYGADPAKRPGFLTLLRHYLVGAYFAVLPTGVAGEAVRGYRVAACFTDAATSYVVLFVERVAGLLGLLTVA